VTTARQRQDVYQASDVFAWSADSRWLFSLHQGELTVVNPSNGRTITPDLGLPELLQIVLRPSAASRVDR
jgi:hypothetical protein